MPPFKANLSIAAAITIGILSLPLAVHSAPAKAAAKPAAKSAAKPKITFSSPSTAVAAKVNGIAITKSQVEQAAWQRYAVQIVSELIDKTCIRQAAEKAGVKITKADIDVKVSDLKTKLPPGVTFPQFLAQYNLTESQLRDELKTNIYVEKASAKSVKVSDQDVAGFIKARHILLNTTGATPEERTKSEEANKAKLVQLTADIKAGTVKFEDAAKQNSEDPGSKEKGGDLGWFKRGAMVAEFDEAAFKLKVGDISEPVKTVYGYHIIQVESLGNNAPPAEKAELTKRIRDEKLRPEMTAWYLRVKEDCIKGTTRYLGEAPKPQQPMMRPNSAPPRTAPKTAPKPPSDSGGEAPPPPPAP